MKKTPASPENYHHYSKDLKFIARKLRRSMTKAEKKLWQMIRRKSIHGCMFLRQRSVLDYVADFMCKELKLIIEVDGGYHNTPKQQKKDKLREDNLKEVGFTFLRFKNWEVLYSPNGVYMDIKEWVEEKMKKEGIPIPPESDGG